MLAPLHDIVSNARPWASVGTEVAGALALSLITVKVLQGLLSKGTWIQPTLFGAMWTRARHAVQLVLPLAGVEAVLGLAPDNLSHVTALRRVLMVALVASITIGSAQLIAAFGDWLTRHHRMDVADNLEARRIHTQTRILVRALNTGVLLFGLSTALMTFPSVRHFGMSLLASAGVAGLVVGLAARSVLGNLLAGLQIAITQPIRIDDVVVINGEWGRVEEISSAYVTVHIWDDRRLIVPLEWLTQNPFTNWTRTTAAITGTVFLWVDFGTPVDLLRKEVEQLARSSPDWDGRVCALQVTDANARAMQIRVLLSAMDSGRSFNLCCFVREGMASFLSRQHPGSLPRLRIDEDGPPRRAATA